jgi:nicotinamide-nucleotide amidase
MMERLAKQVGEKLLAEGLKLATAESCTGGWVAQTLTSVPGSSDWFERGFVTYSNEAKQELLGVRAATLEEHGAVSEETAREMAEGALKHGHAHVAISTTGVAGPNGGTVDKPVGMVCFAIAQKKCATHSLVRYFKGDRQSVREQSVEFLLQWLLERC